jgi:hypothetical protein
MGCLTLNQGLRRGLGLGATKIEPANRAALQMERLVIS